MNPEIFRLLYDSPFLIWCAVLGTISYIATLTFVFHVLNRDEATELEIELDDDENESE